MWGLGILGEEIDLSPAAKSHCMALCDREHYSQSLWINSVAVTHNPPDKLSHSKQCMMGEPPECSVLKPSDQAGVKAGVKICFGREVLLSG